MEMSNAVAQRAALLELACLLGSLESALRRDECGDWRINGRNGHIYAVPEGFQIYFCGTVRSWGFTKKAIGFAKATQDGDGDGCLILGRLLTRTEAAIIRERLGTPKKRTLGEQELEKLRTLAMNGGFSRQKPPPATAPGTQQAARAVDRVSVVDIQGADQALVRVNPVKA
jgi:hypothetical protein